MRRCTFLIPHPIQRSFTLGVVGQCGRRMCQFLPQVPWQGPREKIFLMDSSGFVRFVVWDLRFFSPRCQQYSGIFSLGVSLLKPNLVWTILLSLRKIVVSRWFREVSCRARLLTDQSWPHWAAQGGRRQRLKAWCFLCFLCLWHRHHPSIIFPSSSTIQSFTIQPFTNHCINDPLLIIYCIIPALAISFHSVVTSASSWQWLRRCFFLLPPGASQSSSWALDESFRDGTQVKPGPRAAPVALLAFIICWTFRLLGRINMAETFSENHMSQRLEMQTWPSWLWKVECNWRAGILFLSLSESWFQMVSVGWWEFSSSPVQPRDFPNDAATVNVTCQLTFGSQFLYRAEWPLPGLERHGSCLGRCWQKCALAALVV